MNAIMRMKRRRRDRRGWTILEACAAMVVGGTIYGISVQLLAISLRASEVGRDRALAIGALARLAEQFRADVHAAEKVEASPDGGDKLHWTMKLADDERVEFEFKDRRLL